MREFLVPIYQWMDPLFLIYFGAIYLVYAILYILGSIRIYSRIKEVHRENFLSIIRSNSLPEISFIIPAYNESSQISSMVDGVVNLSYRYKRIIIINDGSEDNTLDILKKKLQLIPIPRYYKEILPTKPVKMVYQSKAHSEIIVIDKENGMKFDALNAGLNACNTPYFITVDADTFISDADFEALIRPILEFPETIGVGASVRIKDGCDFNFNRISTAKFPNNFLTAMQFLEYLRSFLMREGWDYAGGNFCIAGAFAVFSTDVVIKAKGYGPTFANDLEIVVRLHRLMKASKTPYRIVYLPDPVAWTLTPQTFSELGHQRMLWHRGLLESLWFHKTLFFNPRYGAFGLFVYPFYLFGEAIEPLVEIIGYIYIIVGVIFGIVHPVYIVLFLCITWGFTFVLTLFSLLVEEFSFRKYPSFLSFAKLFGYNVMENFGYRQLTLIWRLNGFFSFYKRFDEIKKDTKKINELVEKALK